MEKVKCIKCGSTGYTASPESTKCEECGGSLEMLCEDQKVKDEEYYHFDKFIVGIRRMYAKCSGGA